MSDFHSIAKDQLTDRIYAYFDDEELLDTLADNLKEILVTEYEHHKKRSAGLHPCSALRFITPTTRGFIWVNSKKLMRSRQPVCAWWSVL